MLKSVVILNFVFGNAFNLIPHPLDGKIAYINGLTKKDIVSLSKSEVLELKYKFSKHPLLVFQDIKELETKEFVNFVKLFDDYADEEAIKYPGEYPNQMLQPFDQLPDCKHVAPRGNMFLEDYEGLKNLQIEPFTPFKENYVWHTDMLGHDYKMTNLVTGFYTKKSPLIGGETDFISGETIYKSLNNDEKEACKNILVEINRHHRAGSWLTPTCSSGCRMVNRSIKLDSSLALPGHAYCRNASKQALETRVLVPRCLLKPSKNRSPIT